MKAEFQPRNMVLCTIALALATFMQVLDTTIANVSLATIAGNLGVSNDQSTWVITSFAVSNAIALPLTGFLTRRFGEVKLFAIATLLFSLASFLCGIAANMGMLVGFRALQGFVAGPMYPITQALLLSIYPPDKRTHALALIATVTVVAPVAGPILGGWITDNYSWPWIFFINVPIGIFSSAMVWNQMRSKPARLEKPRMDWVGLVTLIIGVGALQLVLDKGNDEDWFNSSFIVWTSVISVVTLAVFIIWEWTDKDPIVDLRLFRHRNFSTGTLSLMVAYAGFFSIGVLVPQWLQTQIHYTATWSGLATAPIGFFPILLTTVVAKYATKIDLRLIATAAFCVMGGTCLTRSGFNTQVDFYHVAFVQLIQGFGVAFFFMPVLTIVLSDLNTSEIASGSGLATFLRTLAGSFATSITTYMWGHRAIIHHSQLTEHFTPYNPHAATVIEQIGHGDVSLAAAKLEQMIVQQSYQMSFNEIMYVLGILFILLIGVLWLSRPPFHRAGGKAPAGGH